MDSAKYVTQHKRLYISIGKKNCFFIKFAGQYTVDNMQTGCTGYIHSSNTDDGE